MKNRIVVIVEVLLLTVALSFSASAQSGIWKEVLKPTYQVLSLAESNRGVLWAGGFEGNLYRSTNDGDSWDTVCNIEGGLRGLFAMPSGHLVCFTYAKSYTTMIALWSTDAGRSWTQSSDTIDALFFEMSPQGVLFRSTDRYLWRSTDEGITWDTFLKNPRNFITGIFFDSCSHVLISYEFGVERSSVTDSNWTVFSSSGQNFGIRDASIAPNGDIVADVWIPGSGSEGIAIYRDGHWTLRGTVRYQDDINHVQPFVDSNGNVYCLIGSLHQSSDYGASVTVTGTVGNCDGSRFIYSRNRYLFAAVGCEVIRSVNPLHDSIMHFPTNISTACLAKQVATNLGPIRGIVNGSNKLYLSNGGIAQIFKINGGAVGFLTSMPEGYGGPMVLLKDSFYFVNYDNDHPANNWSKVSKIPSSGGLAQQNILLQTQKITDMKADDTALYLFCVATSATASDGKLQRYSLRSRTLVTLVDSVAAFDGISLFGDSIYFGVRNTASKPGALYRLSKSGGDIRVVKSGATGSCTLDSAAIAYYSLADSLLHYSLRSQDTTFFTTSTSGAVRRIQMDRNFIYALADDSCHASLLKIARTNPSTLVLDDSIRCNAEFVVDSAFVYVSDDLNNGRVRAICNPTQAENRSAIIPAKLDFGTVSVQSNVKLLPIENNSNVDYSVYPTVTRGQFSIYPPYLSIPAHSTMSFKVYCLDTTSPEVEDVVDFSINGASPYASTRLIASRPMSVSSEVPKHGRIEYSNGSILISNVIGEYRLTRFDALGRVLDQWQGVGSEEPVYIPLSDKRQFSVLRLQQGNAAETLKIFH
jgi:hypothetical protein